MSAMPAPQGRGEVGGKPAPQSSEPPKPPKKPITWTSRVASAADMAGILQCREATFVGEDLEKADPAYWRWEFVDNHAGPAHLYVAADGDRIVGHYAVIPQTFVLDRQRLPGSIVVDVMTHPDYRFQGMFTTIGAFALADCERRGGLEFTTGYPIREAVIPGHLKVGWRIRFLIGTYVMPLRMGPLLAARLPWLGKVPGLAAVLGALPGALLRAFGAWRLRRGADAKVRIERRDTVDAARLDALWQKVAAAPPARTVLQERTAAFLAWRFDGNPNRDYTWHLATDQSGALAGFVVSRIAKLLGVDAMIAVDVLLAPGVDEGVLRRLLGDVRELAVARGCAMVATMVTQPSPYVPPPARLGFLAAPYRFSFITRPLAQDCRTEDDGLRWHLMWGDTDDL
jgi:hypothetical protein